MYIRQFEHYVWRYINILIMPLGYVDVALRKFAEEKSLNDF